MGGERIQVRVVPSKRVCRVLGTQGEHVSPPAPVWSSARAVGHLLTVDDLASDGGTIQVPSWPAGIDAATLVALPLSEPPVFAALEVLDGADVVVDVQWRISGAAATGPETTAGGGTCNLAGAPTMPEALALGTRAPRATGRTVIARPCGKAAPSCAG